MLCHGHMLTVHTDNVSDNICPHPRRSHQHQENKDGNHQDLQTLALCYTSALYCVRESPPDYNIKFIQTVRYQLYPDSTKSNVSRLYNIKCIQTVQYQMYQDFTISNVSRQYNIKYMKTVLYHISNVSRQNSLPSKYSE